MRKAPWLVLAAALALAAGPAAAAAPERGTVPVAVYVNVDEMASLWPFRDPKTGAFPRAGETGHEAYMAQWGRVVGQAFRELRRRMPRRFHLFAAGTPDTPYALRIDVWVADLATSCDAPTFYKYLWVRTHSGVDGWTTNWDGLGVRSETLVSTELPIPARRRSDLDAWVELWAQVPYLHLAPPPEGATPGPGDADA